MEEITVTQNGFDCRYTSYLYGAVKDRFSFLPAEFDFQKIGESETLFSVKTDGAYCPYIRKFTEESLAEIFVIAYKYQYFKKRLPLPLLQGKNKRILLTALVAADYREDRAYTLRKIRGGGSYSLDGLYHFKLRELTARWQEIADCVPVAMGEQSLDRFLGFLTEDGSGKAYIKDGHLYDENYRKQQKSALTGKAWTVGEVLLSQAEKVYCFGETDGETKAFLKKYYGEKATFC